MKLSAWEKGPNPDTYIRRIETDGSEFDLHAAPMFPDDHFGDCIWSVWQDGRMKKSGVCEGLYLAKQRAEATTLILSGENLLLGEDVA